MPSGWSLRLAYGSKFINKGVCRMSLLMQSTWRRRILMMAVATPGTIIALVFSLMFSITPALAATIHISTDPFTQTTCHGSNTT